VKWRARKSHEEGRRLHAAAIWLLFAAQLQLVFAAELHRHGYPFIATKLDAGVSASHGAPRPMPSDGAACVVCQIVRQGAARPAAIGYIARPSNRVFFHLVAARSRFPNLAVITLPARAPPTPNGF
jgi:hypothetical protein